MMEKPSYYFQCPDCGLLMTDIEHDSIKLNTCPRCEKVKLADFTKREHFRSLPFKYNPPFLDEVP